MVLPLKLRVIGSRRMYRFFLPSAGEFESCEFVHILPSEEETQFAQLPADGALTIVVDPDDYKPADLDNIPNPVVFWFLRRFGAVWGNQIPGATVLLREARQQLNSRLDFLRSLTLSENRFVVVSDEDSRELLASAGCLSVLSPPPVSKEISRATAQKPATPKISLYAERNDLTSAMASRIHSFVSPGDIDLQKSEGAVILSENILPSFPYPVAVGASLGWTIFSSRLGPRWGLEAGLDYVEISTPEELFHAVLAFRKNSSQFQLMRFRVVSKSVHFAADRVWSRLLANLGLVR